MNKCTQQTNDEKGAETGPNAKQKHMHEQIKASRINHEYDQASGLPGTQTLHPGSHGYKCHIVSVLVLSPAPIVSVLY